MAATLNPNSKAGFAALVLIVSASAVIAYQYFNQVDLPNVEPRLELHNQIIEGTASPPYRYRVLVPLLAEISTKALSIALSYEKAFLLSYALYDWLAISCILAILYVWLRCWFTAEQSLIGVLFVACTMPIALQDHYFQPWSLLETALVTASLLAIYRRQYWLLAVLVLLASLNRETAVFIPLTFLFTALETGGTTRFRVHLGRKPS